MRFSVFTQNTDGLEQVILNDQYMKTQVAVHPDHGAMLHAFRVQTTGGEWNVIDNYHNQDSLQKELAQSFKGSKLSPFVCRIPQGKYDYKEKHYELQNKYFDGSSIHGLLYNKPFKVVDSYCDDSSASVTLKYNYKKDDEGYPFKYRCEINYSLLADNILQISTTILNLDDLEIPIADGWHPYFTLSGKIDDWLLRVHSDSILELDQKLVPTGRLLPFTVFHEESAIAGNVLDHCFLLKREEAYAACTLFNPGNGLAVSFFPDGSYPYLLVYTSPDRQSVAIENLSAAPNCFNNKIGLILLPPRHSKTFTIQYLISLE